MFLLLVGSVDGESPSAKAGGLRHRAAPPRDGHAPVTRQNLLHSDGKLLRGMDAAQPSSRQCVLKMRHLTCFDRGWCKMCSWTKDQDRSNTCGCFCIRVTCTPGRSCVGSAGLR